MAQAILRITEDRESKHPNYTVVISTTDLLSKIPGKPPFLIPRDAIGFFNDLIHTTTLILIDEMLTELFGDQPANSFLQFHTKKVTWRRRGYTESDPKHISLRKAKWLIHFLIKNDYTIFQDTLYKALTGTPQGAPMSSTYSSLATWGVEKKLIPLVTTILRRELNLELCWLRYADDSASAIPDSIFLPIVEPQMNNHGITFKKGKAATPGSPGMELLDTTIHIKDDHSVHTMFYSKKQTLAKHQPLTTLRMGATPSYTIRSARLELLRRFLRASNSIQAYINDIQNLLRHKLHTDLSPRLLAMEAERVLRGPRKSRYNLQPHHYARVAKIIRHTKQ